MEDPKPTGYSIQTDTNNPPPPQAYAPQPSTFPKVEQPPQYGQQPPQYGQPPVPQYGQPPVPQYGQQQQTSNVVVVNQQPTLLPLTTTQTPQDHYLTLSIVMSVLCFICCGWCGLCCTLPAIFFATSAREAEVQGDIEGARSKARGALILNVVAIVWWVVSLVIYGVIVGVRAAVGGYSSCGYSYTYSYNYC